MGNAPTRISALLALAVAALCAAAAPVSALDPVLAKMCREKALEAHPYKPAGSSGGSAQAQRNYYNECIAKGGKMDPEPQAAEPQGKGESAPAAPPAK